MNTLEKIFNFGEKVEGFNEPVLNERELRAGAGILFLFAILSFMSAWNFGNFYWTKIMVVAFLIDFAIRVFVNPSFAPSLVVGRFFVRKQTPEYVGAKQKRFAWGIGLTLAVLMFFLIVVNNVIGPVNLLVCLTCLVLLFFESVFGICLGCKVYNLFHKDRAQHCPGGVCENEVSIIQKITIGQVLVVIVFLAFVWFVSGYLSHTSTVEQVGVENVQGDSDCTVPEWAKKIGHEEKWKLHHGCADK